MPPAVTSDELRARVGVRIRDIAKRRHLPMIEVAERAGISRSTLWAVLAGRTPATTDTLARVAEALGVDPIELLRAPREPKPKPAGSA